MRTYEIYFNDLIPEAQQELLDKLSLSDAEANWEVFPLTVLSFEDEEDD
jgi:hypothetical protein